MGRGKTVRNPATADDMMADEIAGYTEYWKQSKRHEDKTSLSRTFESMATDELKHLRTLAKLKAHGHINPAGVKIVHSKYQKTYGSYGKSGWYIEVLGNSTADIHSKQTIKRVKEIAKKHGWKPEITGQSQAPTRTGNKYTHAYWFEKPGKNAEYGGKSRRNHRGPPAILKSPKSAYLNGFPKKSQAKRFVAQMRRRSPGRYEIRKKGKCWNVYFIRKKILYDIEKMEDDQRSGQFLPSRYYKNPKKKLTLRQIRYKYRQERLAQKCRTKGCPGVPHGGSWPYCRDCQDEMNYGEHDYEEENPRGSIVCRACGERISKKPRYCPECGHDTYCSGCGDCQDYKDIVGPKPSKKQLKYWNRNPKVLPLRIKAGKRIVEAVTSKVPQPYLTPKVIYFDSKHRPVRYRMVDSSGKVIKKYFWRFVDKQGNFLTPAQIKPFVKIKGKLKPAKKYTPTLGSGGMMEVLKLIPASRERNYVFTTAYSMKGRSKMFYKFMDYLIAKKKVAIVPLVYRAGFQYHFGLISPRKNQSGQYSIMLKAISQKIKPDWHSIAKAEVPVQHKSQAKRLKKKMKRVI
jgi:hypothetical protein